MEKKNTSLIVIIVVLAICLLGVTGYLVYDRVFIKDNMVNDLDNNTNKNSEKSNTLSDDEIKDLGKTIYDEFLTKADMCTNEPVLLLGLEDDDSPTGTSFMDSLNLGFNGKLGIAFMYLNNDEISYYSLDDMPKVGTVTKETLVKVYKKVFGENITVSDFSNIDVFFSHESGSATTIECYISDDKTSYNCNYIINGCDPDANYNKYAEYKNAKIEKDDIVINTKYLDKSYNVTFKQDTNGNYYWYSTRLVK